MTHDHQLTRLLTPIVRRFNVAEPTFDDQGFAMITTDDEITIHFHAPPDSKDLNLYILLGALPEMNRGNLVSYAMGSNWLNRRTRGAVLSVAGEDNTLILQRNLSRAKLTPEALDGMVVAMKRVAEIWKVIFKKAEEEAEAAGLARPKTRIDPTQLGMLINPLQFA